MAGPANRRYLLHSSHPSPPFSAENDPLSRRSHPSGPPSPSCPSPHRVDSYCDSFATRSTTRRTRIMVVMGSCNWSTCSCAQGSCITTCPNEADLCSCGHKMADHDDYVPPSHPPQAGEVINKPTLPYPCISREEVVKETLRRVEEFRLVRISGTPASGKTTLMNLIIRQLLADNRKPIYLITGWTRNDVQESGGWARHLERETGVNGYQWSNYPGYLFLDEAQMSYWDVGLWSAFFKAVEPTSKCRVFLFTAYGSPDRGGAGLDEPFQATPMNFSPAQQIPLRADKNVSPYYTPVGLLLTEHETMQLVQEYFKASHSTVFRYGVSDDFKRGVWNVTRGLAGLVKSLVDVIARTPDIRPFKDNVLCWQTVLHKVFSNPLDLCGRLQHAQFYRGLPRPSDLQDPAINSVFEKAVLSPPLTKSSFRPGTAEFTALHKAWSKGWLYAEPTDDDISYDLPSDVHRWLCACAVTPVVPGGNSWAPQHSSPFELAKDVIRRFNPRLFSEPERASGEQTVPLEDQYGKEFYRCLHTTTKGRIIISPEFMINTGSRGGSLDFFLMPQAWGIELLRENDRIAEHIARFEPGGQYHDLRLSQWIVLNCTTKLPLKRRPEFLGQFYHVFFADNFKSVTILDSNLETRSTFYLLENDFS